MVLIKSLILQCSQCWIKWEEDQNWFVILDDVICGCCGFMCILLLCTFLHVCITDKINGNEWLWEIVLLQAFVDCRHQCHSVLVCQPRCSLLTCSSFRPKANAALHRAITSFYSAHFHHKLGCLWVSLCVWNLTKCRQTGHLGLESQ